MHLHILNGFHRRKLVAMRRELAWITIRCFQRRDTCKIEVENWGAPIQEEELAIVVESGRRGRLATRAGTGRGLSIARQEVEGLGGRLEISSRPARNGLKRRGRALAPHINVVSILLPIQ